MATSSRAFCDALSYSLAQLKLSVSLKEEQKSAIEAVVNGKDVFVCLPTGYGKSLCYQTLPFVFDALRQEGRSNSAVLVVSPLIALMEDQVSSLRSRGVKASIITTSTSVVTENISTRRSLAIDSLFYCAPEALITSKWRDAFDMPEFSGRIVAYVVDEAHCVSKW